MSPLPSSLQPLLHLICSSPSIQIVRAGMTEPVVGRCHRHARTMRCDGDIRAITPPGAFFPLSGFCCVDFSKRFLNVLCRRVTSCSDSSAPSLQHVRLFVMFSLRFQTPCRRSHEIVSARLLKLQDLSLRLSGCLCLSASFLSFSLFFFAPRHVGRTQSTS